ncbi:MAG: hypothetical protein Q8R82_06705 [Hyphomonadaceae bacterium]|nr:hypothetical protein [Hyphomonadaceae bacterium]
MIPILMTWDGEAMTPLPRFAKLADTQYVIGEAYRMTPVEERSEVSHNHEFAWLKSAWQNLPHPLDEEFPSPEHFRKRLLIDTGFYDEQIVDAGTNAAAIRVAAAFRQRDEFISTVIRGPIVVIRTAQSQSRRNMDKERFQASKTAIMEAAAALIGVTPEQLSSQGAGAGTTRPAVAA